MAIIEQESTWQSDPKVANLDKIVWKEIENRASKYHLPMVAVKLAFLKPSPDGRSYKARIDALTTEKQMNTLFEDIVLDAQKIGLPFEMKNPIRTGEALCKLAWTLPKVILRHGLIILTATQAVYAKKCLAVVGVYILALLTYYTIGLIIHT